MKKKSQKNINQSEASEAHRHSLFEVLGSPLEISIEAMGSNPFKVH